MRKTLTIENLRCEYLANPLGIDILEPRLSWRLSSPSRGARQSAYQVLVASSLELLDKEIGDLWDTGQVQSDETIHIVYAGKPLHSRQRCFWKVRVWDSQGSVSGWSEPASWEMGLLDKAEWQAQWIAADIAEDISKPQPSPMLRTTFAVDGPVKKARIYVTSRGSYELHLNSLRVGDAYFTPGWTSYHKRLQYQVYDVTDQLCEGENALGALLGDGWFRGYYFIDYARNFYGDSLALLAQLEIEYEHGGVQVIKTDEHWRSATGPIRYADHYMGECYDARLEQKGWAGMAFDDRAWSGVSVCDFPKGALVASCSPPVKKIQELKPVDILFTPAGSTVFDFGQNLVGWVRLSVSGPAGTAITLRHSEVLDKDGNFYVKHLRSAEQKVTYILRGEGVEAYEPHFTFQGFRYVEISGYPGELTPDALVAVVLHSEMAPTGSFECSNPLINQLQHNITWGQKGNFLDVPTDCPQRDERLGWTGDAQVFARTACFNFDVAAFFTKWLRDVAADQHTNGAYPHYVPHISTDPPVGSAVWGDAGVICPWILYQIYGDDRILSEQYESMTGWIDYLKSKADDDLIWRKGFQFGDWLATDRPDLGTPFGLTDVDLIGTAFFAYSSSLMARIASALAKETDAAQYEALSEQVRQAFCNEFVTPKGRIGANTQTAYVLALAFDLLPDDLRADATARLVANIRERDNHLSTGFVGTYHLPHVLSRNGYLDVAYDLLLQDTAPSWLYPITKGATTIWERWDSIRPDGSFQTPEMNSFNHYAYGAIGEWLYSVVAGLNADTSAPAYKHIVIRPRPGGGLTYARATYASIRGEIVSAWRKTEDGLEMELHIPANCSASVYLPATSSAQVLESGRLLSESDGIQKLEDGGQELKVEIGSGRYRFYIVN